MHKSNNISKMSNYLLILLVIGLVVAGQLLLKSGMTQIGSVSLSREQILPFIVKAVSSPFIISGLVLYFLSTFLWLIVISKAELSSVQPVTALSYVFITFFSWLLFKENVNLIRILGVVAITFGVFLVARS